MTRRYDVRTGMVDEDPDAGQPREELVPGWHVPDRTRYDYDLRIGDAERDVVMAQLREHFVAGRLTFDELSERIDAALIAKTQRQIDRLTADLPRLPRPARPEPALPVWKRHSPWSARDRRSRWRRMQRRQPLVLWCELA